MLFKWKSFLGEISLVGTTYGWHGDEMRMMSGWHKKLESNKIPWGQCMSSLDCLHIIPSNPHIFPRLSTCHPYHLHVIAGSSAHHPHYPHIVLVICTLSPSSTNHPHHQHIILRSSACHPHHPHIKQQLCIKSAGFLVIFWFGIFHIHSLCESMPWMNHPAQEIKWSSQFLAL